jgi:catalase
MDRESSQRDLFDAIERKEFPKWKMFVQVMTEEEAKTYSFHPFDLTKVWSKKDFPLIPVGEFELNRNPENYFQDVEQAAFNPTNIVPGIGFSPDKMLQGRLFSYGDAQRYRLGVNHYQIPVNKPTCPYHSNHRDGTMRVDGNHGGTLHYNPNSYGEWQEQPDAKEPPLELDGTAYAHNFRDDDEDYYTQPGDLFRIIKSDGKADLLFNNTAAQVGGAEKFIQIRHIRNCFKADPEYGEGVAKALGLTMDEVNSFDMTPYDRWAPRPTKG